MGHERQKNRNNFRRSYGDNRKIALCSQLRFGDGNDPLVMRRSVGVQLLFSTEQLRPLRAKLLDFISCKYALVPARWSDNPAMNGRF